MILKRIINKVSNLIRISKLNKYNDVSYKAQIDKKSKLEKNVSIFGKSFLHETNVGKMTYISDGCILTKTNIGKYCSIGPNVKVIAGRHPTREFVSTHPIFYSNKKFCQISYCNENKFEEYKYADEKNDRFCIIGNDVWIGQDVRIIDGVTIGNGAIIAAGAIVTKDVQPYEIVGGVPAKSIRNRFDKEDVDYLLNLKWWDKTDEWLKNNAFLFENIQFLKTGGKDFDKQVENDF